MDPPKEEEHVGEAPFLCSKLKRRVSFQARWILNSSNEFCEIPSMFRRFWERIHFSGPYAWLRRRCLKVEY